MFDRDVIKHLIGLPIVRIFWNSTEVDSKLTFYNIVEHNGDVLVTIWAWLFVKKT